MLLTRRDFMSMSLIEYQDLSGSNPVHIRSQGGVRLQLPGRLSRAAPIVEKKFLEVVAPALVLLK